MKQKNEDRLRAARREFLKTAPVAVAGLTAMGGSRAQALAGAGYAQTPR